MKTVLSGIAPSGNLHIGNYLGAIRQWVKLQKEYRVFAMVADLHALTTPQDPAKLKEKTIEIVKILLACGIDPKKSTVFIQSHVPAHTELAWILNTITPVGELERMTQFKEKKEKTGVFAGLLNYPVLQAADILLYQTDLVPVGEDQIQHLELTRTLAQKFNNRFGKVFKIPQPLIVKGTTRIMGLDDPAKKMSKSASNPANYIAILDSPENIREKIKTAVTDSEKEIKYDPQQKPAISNLMDIYSAFSDLSHETIEKRYQGKGYAEFKKDLAELLIKNLSPIQKKYGELSQKEKEVLGLIQMGAKKAQNLAAKTLSTAKRVMGLTI